MDYKRLPETFAPVQKRDSASGSNQTDQTVISIVMPCNYISLGLSFSEFTFFDQQKSNT
jgi:hypothetical protein